MIPTINKKRTGKNIKAFMEMRGLSVQDVRESLSLGSVQTVYHWLEGKSLPSLDNLYALSELLRVPMDMLVTGDRRYRPNDKKMQQKERMLRYYTMFMDISAA